MCAGLKNDSQRGLVGMAITKHLTVLPYSVTGTVGLAGSEQAPKYICTDRIIGTWEAA